VDFPEVCLPNETPPKESLSNEAIIKQIINKDVVCKDTFKISHNGISKYNNKTISGYINRNMIDYQNLSNLITEISKLEKEIATISYSLSNKSSDKSKLQKELQEKRKIMKDYINNGHLTMDFNKPWDFTKLNEGIFKKK
jgi:hypothetical protein